MHESRKLAAFVGLLTIVKPKNTAILGDPVRTWVQNSNFYMLYAHYVSTTKIRDYATVFRESGTDVNNSV